MNIELAKEEIAHAEKQPLAFPLLHTAEWLLKELEASRQQLAIAKADNDLREELTWAEEQVEYLRDVLASKIATNKTVQEAHERSISDDKEQLAEAEKVLAEIQGKVLAETQGKLQNGNNNNPR